MNSSVKEEGRPETKVGKRVTCRLKIKKLKN